MSDAIHTTPFNLERRAELWEQRARNAEEDVNDLLTLLYQVRAAAGDPHGKMSQPELVAHIQEMREVLTQTRADMRECGGGISTKTLGRMQAVIIASGGGT